jgi:mannose-1-phosphate guanylyltransferase
MASQATKPYISNPAITKAILLVGGKGTRLAPLTDATPKPMLKVAGKPVTEHQIVKAREAGITHLVLATSYLAEVFEPYFGDGSRFGISITYAVEKEPLGTGGAIANAADQLEISQNESILIFNGDVLSGHDLKAQIALHQNHKADVTLYLTRVEDPRAYGCVPLTSEGRVLEFLEKMENPIADTINAGCYIFSNSALSMIPRNAVVSVEREIFPALLDGGFDVFGYHDGRYWIDMGTPQSFVRASRDLVMQPEISSATVITGKGLYADREVQIDSSAIVGGGSAISSGVKIGPKATVMGSIIGDNVEIGEGAEVIDSYIAAGLKIPPTSSIQGQILAN